MLNNQRIWKKASEYCRAMRAFMGRARGNPATGAAAAGAVTASSSSKLLLPRRLVDSALARSRPRDGSERRAP